MLLRFTIENSALKLYCLCSLNFVRGALKTSKILDLWTFFGVQKPLYGTPMKFQISGWNRVELGNQIWPMYGPILNRIIIFIFLLEDGLWNGVWLDFDFYTLGLCMECVCVCVCMYATFQKKVNYYASNKKSKF